MGMLTPGIRGAAWAAGSDAPEKKEVKNFRLGIEAEFAAEQQTTDEAANAIRTAVPSITEMPV